MNWIKVGNIMGPSGTVVPSGYVIGEAAGGAIDGVNKVFSSANAFLASSLAVYLNGLRQRRVDDYNEIGATQFQFLLAPHVGDTISIDYLLPTTGGTEVFGETPTGAMNGVNKTFTTSFIYVPNGLSVFLCGMRLRKPDDFTETSSSTFQLVNAPLATDNLSVDYQRP
jgi:hypothetical protein